MAEPNVIVLIYDGSVQGKDASKYDLYDIQEGIKGDGTLRCPYLLPAPPLLVTNAAWNLLTINYSLGNCRNRSLLCRGQ